MTFSKNIFWAAFGGLLLGTGGVVAQELDPMGPSELREAVVQALAELQGSVDGIASDLQQAESARSAATMECLTGKLSSARTLNDVSAVASGQMEEALQAGELERARHEYRKIAVALERTRQYVAEANNCMGERGESTGVSQIDVQFDGDGEDVDDTRVLDDGYGDVLGVDPPDATPFQ